MTSVSIAIVGAGIHGCHLLTRLIGEQIVSPEQCVVIDAAGAPLSLWNRRTANCTMDFLRSPASHGLNRDFRTIRRMARDHNSTEPLFTAPYHRPSVTLFREHLNDTVGPVLPAVRMVYGRATKLERDRSRWVIHYAPAANRAANEAASTQRVAADNVILALGSPPPNIPEPFRVALKRDQSAHISHIHEAPLHPREISPGSRVAVVGGGIAAAHYLLTAAEHPIAVEFWNRDRLTVSQFDSDPCFVGPRCSHQFDSISTPRLRKRAIARARRPGSVPPDLYERLVRRVVHGRISVHRAAVTRVVRAGNRILLEGPATVSSANDLTARIARDARSLHHSIAREYDYVVLATGFRPEVPGEELLAPIAGVVSQCDGQPFPGSDLAIAPGLFVTGALAELRVGPPARNIIGAHLAARRIVPALRLRVRK